MSSMSSSVQNVGAKIVSATGSNAGMMVLFVFVTLVSIYVAIQLYNIVLKTDLQTAVLVKDVKNIDALSENNSTFMLNENADGERIELPSLHNGNEYSFSYWMYIDEFVVTTNPKLVMYASSADLSDAPIIMYIDGSYNKMHILLKTTVAATTSSNELKAIHDSKGCEYFRMIIPYVPISRWVNISMVIDNDYVQLFMDGELRQVIDTKESFGDNCSTNVTQLSKTMNFYTGKPTAGENLKGFISKLKFFNYALTIDHAKMVYNTGPVHQNILAKLGLPLYGVRNPFYRVDEQVEEDADA